LLTLALNTHKELTEALLPLLDYTGPDNEKIEQVKALYDAYNIVEQAGQLEAEYHNTAMGILEKMPLNSDQKTVLNDIAVMLLGRDA
jgi:geranylgeranyl pyrophosphate synthase